MKTISFDESVWKMVPVELTAEMRAAAKPCTTVSHLWASILSAAPAAPEQQDHSEQHLDMVAQAPNAQQAEPPPWWPAVENILNEYGLQAVDFVADFKAAQQAEAQEPFAWATVPNAFSHPNMDRFLDFEEPNQRVDWTVVPLFTRPKPAQHQLCQGEQP